MTGRMMHHDSITGTSLMYVVHNESVTIEKALDKNAEVL